MKIDEVKVKNFKSLKDLLDKFSRFTNSLVYDGGICKRLYYIIIQCKETFKLFQ